MNLIKELLNKRNLILNLAKNDFKKKYTGSYFGIAWAFLQPILTILVYWAVLQVGFRSSAVENVPYVLWLTCGLIPWFFFSEALNCAAYSFIEYSYLVKQILFKISILPLVKCLSSFFMHIIFTIFLFYLAFFYGYNPKIIWIQLIYYSICLLVFSLSISYITSSVILFFKDLGEIIKIVLQFGVWITPILWSYKVVPLKYQIIFKINPLFYIVQGYRETFIDEIWFVENYYYTIYFWIVTILILLIGKKIYSKLKLHFSDVL